MPIPAAAPRLRLLLRPSLRTGRAFLNIVQQSLPPLAGLPITISFRPELSSHRGKLLSRQLTKGRGVHGGSFIRERKIVLETALWKDPDALRSILIHELFHFVWPRLGNAQRAAYADLLAEEWKARARGELGESADVAKSWLAADACAGRTKHWRDYACESFCDTAAWLYAGTEKHEAYALAERHKRRRAGWFHSTFEQDILC